MRLGDEEEWSPWVKNMVTDYYRRMYFVQNVTTNYMFISGSRADGDARGSAIPAFSVVPAAVTMTDGVALITTFVVTFAAPATPRTIYTAGICHAAQSSGWALRVVAATRRSTAIVQGVGVTADLQYRLSYSAV